MLSIGLAEIEELSGCSPCLRPRLHDGLLASVDSDVMPEKWWTSVGVTTFLVDQIRPVLVDSVVYGDRFILGRAVSVLLSSYLRLSSFEFDRPASDDSSPHGEDCYCPGPRRA